MIVFEVLPYEATPHGWAARAASAKRGTPRWTTVMMSLAMADVVGGPRRSVVVIVIAAALA